MRPTTVAAKTARSRHAWTVTPAGTGVASTMTAARKTMPKRMARLRVVVRRSARRGVGRGSAVMHAQQPAFPSARKVWDADCGLIAHDPLHERVDNHNSFPTRPD